MKRIFDITVVLLTAVLWLPLAVLIGVAVLIGLGRPIFFVQERAGLKGKPFKLVKFRTMRPGPGPDEERLTGTGRFLRSSSLDELPELWNVLKGEMSLVGPRPLLTRYLPRYTPEQARRHEAVPGITGWAQVNGYRGETKDSVLMEKRIEYDLWYIENWTPWLDIQILFLTVWNMIKGDPNAY